MALLDRSSTAFGWLLFCVEHERLRRWCHPGDTFEDGGPLSVGGGGEPIDGVFLTTNSAQKAQPATTPVFPRSIFFGTQRSSAQFAFTAARRSSRQSVA